ncbi:LPXTG cell wall anchor domain-containing protein [Actinomycetes bacterium KLBMP 9797]
MGARWLAVAGTAAVLGLSVASPAMAATTIPINKGNVPTTAADYEQDCDANFGGGPHANQDVWVFVLPDKAATFTSVTAEFDTPDGKVTLTIPADGGAIVNKAQATSKAWITTEAGWTLTGAKATITGEAAKFNLTHTCAAGTGGTPSPSVSPSTTASASPSGSPSPGASASGSVSPAPGAGGGDSGGLPVTGASITGLAVFGGALVAAGAVLALRRRRAVAFSPEGDE